MRPAYEHLACVSPAPMNLSTRQSLSFDEFQQQELIRLEFLRQREYYRRYYEEMTTFPRDLHLRGKPYMIEQILKSQVPSNKTQ